MRREQALAAAGRARPGAGRGRLPASRAAARGSPSIARCHARTLGLALAGVAVLLVLASVPRWSLRPAARRVAPGPSAAIDPRLLIRPRTLRQTARVGGLALTLTASPLVPGSNHFALTLGDTGRPMADAQVRLVATMTGMAMRPLIFRATLVGHGRYEATGALGMFGQWRVFAQISRPGAAPLEHPFGLSLDLPSGILSATGSGAAGR